MSVSVRRAIYGKLAGDTTLTALLGTPASGYSQSIYHEQAPEKADYPFVIFQKQAGTPTYSLGGRSFDDEVWLIKGIDQSSSSDGVDGIASRLNILLTDGTISISGSTQLYLRRESDVEYAELADNKSFRHSGALYRLVYQ